MVKSERGKGQESTAIGESSSAQAASVLGSKKSSTREANPGGTSGSIASEHSGLSPSHLHNRHAEGSSTPDNTRELATAAGLDVVGSEEEGDGRPASPLHSSTTLTTAGSSSAGTSVLGTLNAGAYVTTPQGSGTDEHHNPHLVTNYSQQHHEDVTGSNDSPVGQYSPVHLCDSGRTNAPNTPNTPSRFPVAIKLLVSNNVAGSIIGRQGQTISELQSQSITRIKLSQSGDYFPGTHERVLLVQGEPGHIKIALRLLFHRMNVLQEQECSQRVASWQRPDQTKQQPLLVSASHEEQQHPQQQQSQDVVTPFNFVVRLLVPTSCCGMIIGKAGSNIKFLEQASGVVSVRLAPKDGLSPTEIPSPASPILVSHIQSAGTMERAVTITGPSMESALQCTYMVFEGMLSHPDVSRYSNLTTSYGRNKTQQQQQQVPVDHTLHSSLFGANPVAELNTGMSQQLLIPHAGVAAGGGPVANTLLHSPPPPLGDHQATYGNDGSLVSSPVAESKMIDSSVSPFPLPNEPPNSKRGYLVPTSPICLGPNAFQAQIAVPDSMVGSILGRAGRTLNELQAHSGTRIWISQRGEYIPGTRNRIVTVRGPTAHSIWQAQLLINQHIVLPPTAGHVEDHP